MNCSEIPTCGQTRFVQLPHLVDWQRVVNCNFSLQNIYKQKFQALKATWKLLS